LGDVLPCYKQVRCGSTQCNAMQCKLPLPPLPKHWPIMASLQRLAGGIQPVSCTCIKRVCHTLQACSVAAKGLALDGVTCISHATHCTGIWPPTEPGPATTGLLYANSAPLHGCLVRHHVPQPCGKHDLPQTSFPKPEPKRGFPHCPKTLFKSCIFTTKLHG
jgi:hypothetical protein